MKITVEDTYTDKTFTFDMVGDWAIYARAKDAIDGNGMNEDEAIRMAVEDEDEAFRFAMNQIKDWDFSRIDAVSVDDDDTFTIEDDYYTDDHMVEITEALEKALAEARKADEYNRAYEAEKEWSWYHR